MRNDAPLPADALLPVIDIAAFERDSHQAARIKEAMQRALTESGFMYIQGHGMDSALISQAFAASRGFFDQPRASKDVFAYTDIADNFGYQGIEVESLDPAGMPDLKETFTMRNALKVAMHPARWPDADFRATALAFSRSCSRMMSADWNYALRTASGVWLRRSRTPC